MNISKRLKLVASMVSDNYSVADIGTDHGYIPIYLVIERGFSRTLAMDINEGPLLRAVENIEKYGVGDYVETRLSDGLDGLSENEAESIIIAGMGGILINRILAEGIKIVKSTKELILSPHSDIPLVRSFLCNNNLNIVDENVVFEDNKYYFVFKVINGNMEFEDELDAVYGHILFDKKSPVFRDYLMKELEKREDILGRMSISSNAVRKEELIKETELIKRGLDKFESRRNSSTS